MRGSYNSLLTILLLLTILPVGFAQIFPELGPGDIEEGATNFCTDLFKVRCSDVREIIFYVVVPLAGSWLLVSGVLVEIRIFRNARYVPLVIGFLVSFSLFYSGVMNRVILGLFEFMGASSVFVFAGVFTAGLVMISIRSYRGLSAELRFAEEAINHQLGTLNRERNRLEQLARNAPTSWERQEANRELRDIVGRVNALQMELVHVRRTGSPSAYTRDLRWIVGAFALSLLIGVFVGFAFAPIIGLWAVGLGIVVWIIGGIAIMFLTGRGVI